MAPKPSSYRQGQNAYALEWKRIGDETFSRLQALLKRRGYVPDQKDLKEIEGAGPALKGACMHSKSRVAVLFYKEKGGPYHLAFKPSDGDWNHFSARLDPEITSALCSMEEIIRYQQDDYKHPLFRKLSWSAGPQEPGEHAF